MIELADLFRRHGAGLRGLNRDQRKALRAIMHCRTPALGGHLYACKDCGRHHLACHSCNHRSCPRCGGSDAQAWLERNQRKLLPVPYFMVTFTVPAELRAFARREPALFYRMLMKEAAATLQDVARSKLSGEAGFLGVLHTWTRELLFHPHVHFIVPGGVFDEKRQTWSALKNPDFLLPVAVLSRRFRARMRAALGEAGKAGEHFTAVPSTAWKKNWVVHSQPAGSGHEVLGYLSAYVFRTAISERRILREENGSITFAYTPSGTRTQKTCTLPVEAFLKRVLQHVLPKGLHKIGYFGWLHPRAKARLEVVRGLLQTPLLLAEPPQRPQLQCPHCQHRTLVRIARIGRVHAQRFYSSSFDSS